MDGWMERSELAAQLRRSTNGAEFMSQKKVMECMGWKSHHTAKRHLYGIEVYRLGTRKMYAVADLSKHLSGFRTVC